MKELFTLVIFSLTVLVSKAQTPNILTDLGYTWSMTYKECVQKLKSEKTKFKSEKNVEVRYKLYEEDFRLLFDPLLSQVIKSKTYPQGDKEKPLAYMNKTLEKLVETYGNYQNPRFHQNELMIFEWKFPKASITLLYLFKTNTVSVEYASI